MMTLQSSLVATIGLCFILTVQAVVTPLTNGDVQRLEKSVHSQFQSSQAKSEPSNAHFAFAALSYLSGKQADSTTCSLLEGSFSSVSASLDLAHLVLASEYAGCKTAYSTQAKSSLQKALDSGNILTASFAALAIAKAAQHKRLEAKSFTFGPAVNKALDLMGNSGLFRATEDSETSVYTTGHAHQLLAIAYPTVSDSLKAKIEALPDKVEKILAKGGDNPNFIAFPINPVNNSVLSSTAALFMGLHALSNVLPGGLDLHSEYLSDRFAAFFLLNKYATKLEDISSLLSALHTLADNSESVPIIISSDSKSIRVTNVLDRFVTKARVTVNKVEAIVGTAGQGSALSSSDNIAYSLPSALLTAGVQRVRVNVEPQADAGQKSKSSIRATVSWVTISSTSGEISGKEAHISTSGSADGKDVDSVKASYPSSVSRVLTADSSKYLRVKFSVSELSNAFQCFVVLTHSSGASASFVAQASGQSKEVALDLSSQPVIDALWGSGEYSIEVVVGDPRGSKQLQWRLGSVQITVIDSADLVAYKAKAKQEQDKQAEKVHTFRTDSARPPVVISLVFAVLVLVPLGVFISALPSFGVKLEFPSTASGYLWTILFQVSILSILGLIVVYWLRLNIFQALVGLAVLGSFAVFSGNRALRASSEMSVVHEKLE